MKRVRRRILIPLLLCLPLAWTAQAAVSTAAQATAPAAITAEVPDSAAATLEFPHFGRVAVVRPTGTPQRVVLFVSGDGGWNAGVRDMAKLLAEHGTLVAGIDIRRFLGWVNHQQGSRCISLAGEFENLAHAFEKRVDLPDYIQPTLTGYSSGATLVYAVLAAAPAGTFGGVVSLGFCPDLPIRVSLCHGDGLEYDLDAKGRNVFFRPRQSLPAPWIALQGEIDNTCTIDKARDFTDRTGNAQLVPLPKVGHGYSVPRNWHPQFLAAHERLAAAADPPPPAAPAAPAAPAEQDDLAGLPLIELPVRAATPAAADLPMAVIISGDGGWAGLDKAVAAQLNARGIPVVGLSSLKYFWHPRTPDGAARDLQRVIAHFQAAWKRRRVMLIGYSFGADVLPSLLNRLPAATLASIHSVSLLGLSGDATYEIHLSEWMPGTAAHGEPIQPEVERLPPLAVQCLYGADESNSPCLAVSRTGWHNQALPGGHHFDGDYDQVARSILDFALAPDSAHAPPAQPG